jgi:cytochrome b subunit of formate dehydrogenase
MSTQTSNLPTSAPQATAAEPSFTRFSVRQRVDHFLVMSVFTLLIISGMPQKYSSAGVSAAVVGLFGGINATRLVHRIAGFVFAALVTVHLAELIWRMATKRMKVLTMVPERKDFRDALQTLKYYLGLTKEHARFDRYDYRQKFEYWGMVAGSVIMVATGFALFFPAQVAALLPGQLIPAAKVMHSSEGLLATLVIIVWHIYNAHLNPDVFPFDPCIFTGKISRERMEKEHPLELSRVEAEERAAHGGT